MLGFFLSVAAVAQFGTEVGGGSEGGCSNGSCSAAKKSCAKAFGAAYTLRTSPEPYLLNGGSSNAKRSVVLHEFAEVDSMAVLT